MYRFLDHIADIAVELVADDRVGLFKVGLQAVIALLTDQVRTTEDADASLTKPSTNSFVLSASGYDDEERLVGLLNELLFACQHNRWLPLSVDAIAINSEGIIKAEIAGIPDRGGKYLSREIKAATYHNLSITTTPKWRATVVLDV